MIKINHYQAKENGYMPNSARPGGKWIRKDASHFIGKSFSVPSGRGYFEFSVNIAFVNCGLDDWNDFDSVLVINDDDGQPYTDFYGNNWEKEFPETSIVGEVIKKYNEFMDAQPYLEKMI